MKKLFEVSGSITVEFSEHLVEADSLEDAWAYAREELTLYDVRDCVDDEDVYIDKVEESSY